MLLCNYELRVYTKTHDEEVLSNEQAQAVLDAKLVKVQKQVEKVVEYLRQDETITVTLTEV